MKLLNSLSALCLLAISFSAFGDANSQTADGAMCDVAWGINRIVGLKATLPGGQQPVMYVHDNGELGKTNDGSSQLYFKVVRDKSGKETAFVSKGDPSFGSSPVSVELKSDTASTINVSDVGAISLELVSVPDAVLKIARDAEAAHKPPCKMMTAA